jgi:hypothetical protein
MSSRVQVVLDARKIPAKTALASASVAVNVPGKSAAVPGPLYQGPTGPTTLSNPFTTASGAVNFYMGAPQTVDLTVTPSGQPAIAVPSVPVTAAVPTHNTLSSGGRVVNWFLT